MRQRRRIGRTDLRALALECGDVVRLRCMFLLLIPPQVDLPTDLFHPNVGLPPGRNECTNRKSNQSYYCYRHTHVSILHNSMLHREVSEALHLYGNSPHFAILYGTFKCNSTAIIRLPLLISVRNSMQARLGCYGLDLQKMICFWSRAARQRSTMLDQQNNRIQELYCSQKRDATMDFLGKYGESIVTSTTMRNYCR